MSAFLSLTDEASGSSIDWAYAKLNVALTYTYEFRDKGNESKYWLASY